MNNEELQFAYRVKRALDANLERLPASVTQSLAEARRVALARQKKAAPVHAVMLRFAGALGGGVVRSWLGRLGVAIPLLTGVMLFVGLYDYEYEQHISELAQIDAGVLSDELPLSAYLDHGFNAYLAQQDE